MTLIKIKILWAKACKHDGIKPVERFVVFSKDNPHVKGYNKAMIEFQKGRRYSNNGN